MGLSSFQCSFGRVPRSERRDTCGFSCSRSSFSHQLTYKNCSYYPRVRKSVPVAAGHGPQSQADVVVVGAGVIGLCTALYFLESDARITVAVLDKHIPCYGATGAGQGYIWLCHRDISSPAWELAVHSKNFWDELIETNSIADISGEAIEYQANGSMLIAQTAEESRQLQQRQKLLMRAGVQATHVESGIATRLEQSLRLSNDGSALLVPDDFQISGRQTAAALQEACAAHGPRFTASFHEGVEALLVSSTDAVEGVQTAERSITAGLGVVIAAGAWSGQILSTLPVARDGIWEDVFRPRKGILLEVLRPPGMPEISRGMMEMGYTKHYERAVDWREVGGVATAPAAADADITFTATTSASGTLLVGSSREFSGFDSHAAPEVVDAILQRAVEFLPGLSHARREDITVRAGPRPYSTRGLPLVGPVPGVDGLFVAAGHEGSGLTLAPATARLICHYVLGADSKLPDSVVHALRP